MSLSSSPRRPNLDKSTDAVKTDTEVRLNGISKVNGPASQLTGNIHYVKPHGITSLFPWV